MDAVVLIIGITLARGWFVPSMKLRWFLKKRRHLVSLVTILTLLTSLTQMETIRQDHLHDGYYPSLVTWGTWLNTFLHSSLGYLAYSVALLIFLILFFPAQNQKAPKRD